jgi:CSLREA domain-containing protein
MGRTRLAGAVVAGWLALVGVPAGAQAATFVVTKATDDNGPCDADCSLREAVIAANANAEQDVITLPAGHHVLSLGTVDEDAAAGGDLDVADTAGPAFDISEREIGERLGISQMHVSRLLRRALDRLRTIAQASM